MSTHLHIPCPHCRRCLQVRRAYIGKTVGCRYCDQDFVVSEPADQVSPTLPESTCPIPPGPEAGPGTTEPWQWPRDDALVAALRSKGAWEDGSDPSPGTTRATQDPSWAEVHVVRAELGRSRPEIATSPTPGSDLIRIDLGADFVAREPPREDAEGPSSERQREALSLHRLTEELEAIRAEHERIAAERLAALDETSRHRAALYRWARALRYSRRRHEAAYKALAREHAVCCGGRERERIEEFEQRDRMRSEHSREIAAALRHFEEQLDALRAERDRCRHALDSANRSHEQSLADLRGESAAVQKQAEERFANLRDHFEAQRGALREERERLREGSETLRRERESLSVRLEEVERERHLLAVAGEGLGQRVRDLELALIVSQGECKESRDEARRLSEDLVALRRELEQARGQERAAVTRNTELTEQVRAQQIESERMRQVQECECLESRQRAAMLQEEMEARRGEWQEELESLRRQFQRDLQALREDNDRGSQEAILLRHERDLALHDVKTLAEGREKLDRAIGAIEASRQGAEQRSRAEISRLTAELAEAGLRHESVASRNDVLSREVAGLRAEVDQLRMERESLPQPLQAPPAELLRGAGETELSPVAGRVLVTQVIVESPGTEGDGTDGRRTGVHGPAVNGTEPRGAGGRSTSDQLPSLHAGASSRPSCQPEESPSMAFPSEADLVSVRGQVELLCRLLSPERSSGHVLVYQQRLAEFSRRVREASRLAADLVKEVEQSNRRDEMRFHRYLFHRAEEIEKPRP